MRRASRGFNGRCGCWCWVRGGGRFPGQAYQAYCQRYDLEHFFRFGKTKLLLDRYQTPCVEHEEHWWQVVCLAYIQLWLAAPLAVWFPRPWERYAVTEAARAVPGPGQVQRQFERIIRQLGTPAQLPKRGVIPLGGRRGTVPVAVRANRWCSNAGLARKKRLEAFGNPLRFIRNNRFFKAERVRFVQSPIT